MSHLLPLDDGRLRKLCDLEAEEYGSFGACVWTAHLKPEIEGWCEQNLAGAVSPVPRRFSTAWDLAFEHEHERTWFKLVWW